MLAKEMTYKDYLGNQRKETFYFNLTKAECLEMEMGTDGGMEAMLRRLIESQNMPEIVSIFKKIILAAYGEKSPDGREFIKVNDAGVPLSRRFSQTEAYSDLFVLLSTNAEEAAKFVNAVIPQEKMAAAEPITSQVTASNISQMPTN